ncbi:MAG TPA: DUF4389 domain-containing protein [Dehalococcoidia bacterium]
MSDTLHYDVPYPAELSRLTTFFRIILLIPHLILLALLGLVLYIVTIVAWFAILITGSYPRSMWEFSLSVTRYAGRIAAYYYLMRDEFPPLGGGGEYPITYELEYSEHLSRVTTLFRAILVIPHYIVLYFLQIALSVITFIAWVAILITARYPQGMFAFAVGVVRWQQRVLAYYLLLTDAYPPFNMDADPAAAPGYATGMA